MNSLKEVIQEFVKDTHSRILFLVDELDRCRPDYAISYLETIKHIFDIKGAVFLLAADRQQLENSAKTAFGPDLDFEEYYRKFIHREVTLPMISDVSYKTLASKYVAYYLESDGGRKCFMELDANRVENISDFLGALRLTPRQMQEVFRILGHICETTEENKGRLLWCLALGSIMMSALKIGEPRIFRLLGSQQLEPHELFDFLSRLFNGNQVEWWFFLCLTGGGLNIKEGEKTEETLRSVGLLEEGDNRSLLERVGQYHHGWGNAHSSKFVLIREKIEQLAQWN